MKIRIQEGNYGSLGAYIKDQTLFLTLEGEREDDCAILFMSREQKKWCVWNCRKSIVWGLFILSA